MAGIAKVYVGEIVETGMFVHTVWQVFYWVNFILVIIENGLITESQQDLKLKIA